MMIESFQLYETRSMKETVNFDYESYLFNVKFENIR